MDYFEKDLEIPFLKVLSEHPDGLPMSDIKDILIPRLNPTGTSAEPSPTRAGEIKLHQRIGNFTEERQRRIFTNGWVTYNRTTAIYKITPDGLRHLEEYEPLLESLMNQGFSGEQINRETDRDFTGLIIEEGTLKKVTTNQRQRSDLLRRLKIEQVRRENSGRLPCIGCGFDFEEKYGELGQDFIHIHHTEPVHEMDIHGTQTQIDEALRRVVPLCSNCHSMVHRNRTEVLPIAELQRIIQENSE
ncbi:HNH endonuclease [Candidatus Woesearchaeota archaeon]|nr:HNH endonuclease [Candidatus Woesearchaeota archaeon]